MFKTWLKNNSYLEKIIVEDIVSTTILLFTSTEENENGLLEMNISIKYIHFYLKKDAASYSINSQVY